MRISFSQLFNISNGSIYPKVPIQIAGVTIGNGISFGGGVQFSGIDLSQHIGKDFEVEELNGTYILKGIY